jgi:hypothetical protein
MPRASASVRFAAMAGFPVNVHNAMNIAICHLVRLGLAATRLSVRSGFIDVMLAALQEI